jgi:mono/diheme cytochrome c family protein
MRKFACSLRRAPSWRFGSASAFVLLALNACGGNGGVATTMDPGTGAADAEGDPERGREVYLSSGCGGCHTFAAAGSTRNVGPNLDEAAKRYDAEFLRESIVEPDAYIEKGEAGSIGGAGEYVTEMPAYGPDEKPPGKLSEQQLADLVAFLVAGAS